jgi:hypothetical protein
MTLPEKPEPSVLDYIKGKILPGRNPVIEIPEAAVLQEKQTPKAEVVKSRTRKPIKISWVPVFLIMAMMTFLIAQKSLEPEPRFVWMGLLFYSCGIFWVVYRWAKHQFETDLYPQVEEEPAGIVIRPIYLYVSLGAAFLGFLLFSNNLFTPVNMALWIVSIVAMVGAFSTEINWREETRKIAAGVKRIFQQGFRITLTPWSLLCLAAFILVLFFRFYRLNEVPLEMFSDHAEKLLDVNDILNGKSSIFFIRNTGREAFQMYLSAAVAILFGTGISFMTLKLGTAIMGVFTAVYVYYLGKEVGNRYVGLFAFILCGIGYWPNVITRVGLRYTLYSAFTAPALYYFFKGIRRKKIFDLVVAGIFTGIGLQGYSPYRVVPGLLILGILLYLAHNWKAGKKSFAVYGLIIIGFAAMIFFLPLMRYMFDQPEMFAYRALTRVGPYEHPLPGPAWQIFFNNLWRAVIMPFWDDGVVWAHSIPLRPALDVVSGALYMLGLLVGILRYKKTRDWRILFLIIGVPFLMLPSILSLAFPNENPCLNRTSAAFVPIFIIAAMGLDTMLQNIKNSTSGKGGSWMAGLTGIGLILVSISQNYYLVFDTYNHSYTVNSLNTSEIGKEIADFVRNYDDPDSAYVVGYPYWVDTRLVGINAGFPEKDYAIWPDDFSSTLTNPHEKLFILNIDDKKSLGLLQQMYPEYYEFVYQGRFEGKNFVEFIVPAAEKSSTNAGTKAP